VNWSIIRLLLPSSRKKYKCSLEELEKRIEKEGVPVDNHGIWEDSIEWRNAVEETKKLKKLIEELE